MDTAAKSGREASDEPGKPGTPSSPAMPDSSRTSDKAEKPVQRPEVVEVDGCTFPRMFFPTEPAVHLAAMRRLQVQPDDVFICAFPKAGTHWTWEIVSMLMKGKAEYEPRSKVAMMMDFVPMEDIAAMPSPRVLNTHFLFRFLPYQIREKGARIVFVTRNPKDVAVSLFHHMQGMEGPLKMEISFAEFLPARFLSPGLGPKFFGYHQDWEKVFQVLPDLKVIHMVYEDMKEDLVGNVQRLAEFLGTGASKELCQQIAEACHFDKHKAADKNKAIPSNVNHLMNAQFLKESKLYRKGEVGDWKNWFTVAQNEMFGKVYAERMKGSKLTFRYAL